MVWRNNNEIKSKYTQVEIYSPRMYLLPSRQGLEVRGKPQHIRTRAITEWETGNL